MNIALNAEGTPLSPYLPDEHGLFFIYHFTAEGMRTKDPAQARWTWRSYQITDLHARQEILSFRYGTVVPPPPVGPRVQQVYVAGAGWSPAFMQYLQGPIPAELRP